MGSWTPKTVVVATDGSEQSMRAAEVAATIARTNSAKLFILTVVRPPEGWWGIVGAPPPAEALGSALAEAQQAVLTQTVDGTELDGIEWESVEEIGDPADQVVSFSRSQNADLLVIGQRGAGLVERIMVGSVADRIVHTADMPVLVVP